MNKKRFKKILVVFLTATLIAAFFLLLVFAADEEQGTETPYDVASGGIASSGFTGQEDDNLGDFEVSGDESGSDVETYEGSVDDADGDLEDELDMTDDSGATDDEGAAENAVAAADEPEVELDGAETQIGISGAYLVFHIRKSDEQTMSSYTLTLQKVGDDEPGMTYQKEFEDPGYFDVLIPVLTWQDCPDYSMTPATEYAYRFTVKIDNQEYAVDGTFTTDNDDTTAVSDDPMDGVYLAVEYQADKTFMAYDPDSELVAEITLNDPDAADSITISFSTNGLLIKNVENGDAFETITQNESGSYTFSGRKSDDVTSKVCRVTMKWAALDLADAEFEPSLVSYIKDGAESVGAITYLPYPIPQIPVAVPGPHELTGIPGDFDGNGVINVDDVEYLVFSILIPDEYPVSQNRDFDGNGFVNQDDVEYFVFSIMYPDEYPLT